MKNYQHYHVFIGTQSTYTSHPEGTVIQEITWGITYNREDILTMRFVKGATFRVETCNAKCGRIYPFV